MTLPGAPKRQDPPPQTATTWDVSTSKGSGVVEEGKGPRVGAAELGGRQDNMLPSETISISVVVPVHNAGEYFSRCLESLAAASPAPDEIIVVADGDSDGSWRLAEDFGAKVVRLAACGGPSRARNLGALKAGGDILFFVDADVAVHPDAVGQIAATFGRQPDLAALFGSYDDAPAAANFLSQFKNLFHHYVHQTASEEASTFWSGCGAVRREVFLELGGFDDRYSQPSIEDIELGYRLKQAGHRIRLCKSLQVKHLKRWGAGSLLKSDFFHRAIPWTELILRERAFINDLNLRHSERLSVASTYGMVAALAGAPWYPGLLALAVALALLLIALNARLYRLFRQKHGLRFTLRTIPWHWLYYLYCGLAFAVGTARYLSHKRTPPRKGLAEHTRPMI